MILGGAALAAVELGVGLIASSPLNTASDSAALSESYLVIHESLQGADSASCVDSPLLKLALVSSAAVLEGSIRNVLVKGHGKSGTESIDESDLGVLSEQTRITSPMSSTDSATASTVTITSLKASNSATLSQSVSLQEISATSSSSLAEAFSIKASETSSDSVTLLDLGIVHPVAPIDTAIASESAPLPSALVQPLDTGLLFEDSILIESSPDLQVGAFDNLAEADNLTLVSASVPGIDSASLSDSSISLEPEASDSYTESEATSIASTIIPQDDAFIVEDLSLQTAPGVLLLTKTDSSSLTESISFTILNQDQDSAALSDSNSLILSFASIDPLTGTELSTSSTALVQPTDFVNLIEDFDLQESPIPSFVSLEATTTFLFEDTLAEVTASVLDSDSIVLTEGFFILASSSDSDSAVDTDMYLLTSVMQDSIEQSEDFVLNAAVTDLDSGLADDSSAAVTAASQDVDSLASTDLAVLDLLSIESGTGTDTGIQAVDTFPFLNSSTQGINWQDLADLSLVIEDPDTISINWEDSALLELDSENDGTISLKAEDDQNLNFQ